MNAKAFRAHRELRIMFAAWKLCLTSVDSIILPLMSFLSADVRQMLYGFFSPNSKLSSLI